MLASDLTTLTCNNWLNIAVIGGFVDLSTSTRPGTHTGRRPGTSTCRRPRTSKSTRPGASTSTRPGRSNQRKRAKSQFRRQSKQAKSQSQQRLLQKSSNVPSIACRVRSSQHGDQQQMCAPDKSGKCLCLECDFCCHRITDLRQHLAKAYNVDFKESREFPIFAGKEEYIRITNG